MGGAKTTAMLLDCSIATVYLLLAGKRAPGAALCVAIERHTDGKVTRKQLRPRDWSLIWPELMELEAA